MEQVDKRTVTLTVQTEDGPREVEGVETDHPDLSIIQIPIYRKETEEQVGTVWNISQTTKGLSVLEGFLTEDLALEAVKMLIALKLDFSARKQCPPQLSLFQVALNIISEQYFNAVCPEKKGIMEDA